MSDAKRIGVIGGGITGLAAAWKLKRDRPNLQVAVIESADRVGGVLRSMHVDGYTIEQSADMFTTDPPAAIELLRELGFDDQLLMTTPVDDRAYVASDNGIHPVPKGFSLMLPGDLDAVLNSSLLSEEGKRRFLEEETIPPGAPAQDESLEQFAVRRFGVEMFERLIQPLASGIYTADPKQLSMKATMDRFLRLEQEHGSLIAAGRKAKSTTDRQASGARYRLFRAPEKGIGQLVDWLSDSIQQQGVEIQTKVRVSGIGLKGSHVEVMTDGGMQVFDEVILATPTAVTGRLIENELPETSQSLREIKAASSAIVVLGIQAANLPQPFDGYGIVVPAVLGRKIIACSFSSNKFSGRAPRGRILVRVFIGGALQSELVELPDSQLISLASKELKNLTGFDGETELNMVFRWRNCMPQYTMGHLGRVHSIESQVARQDRLEIAGKGYHGVGIPACIGSGVAAAKRLWRTEIG